MNEETRGLFVDVLADLRALEKNLQELIEKVEPLVKPPAQTISFTDGIKSDEDLGIF